MLMGIFSLCLEILTPMPKNWFKYEKHDIGAKSRARPANFVIDLKVAVESRMRLYDFPGAEKRKPEDQP